MGAVGEDGLFYELMEELLDEGVLGVIALGGEVGDVAGASEMDDLAVIGEVISDCVNGFSFFFGAPAAYGIEMFEREAEGIDHGMAALAGFRFGQFGDFLAHG